jgi:hypothetical protein
LAYRGCGNTLATLCEFDENDQFFITFGDPYMGHTFRLFYTYFTIKRHKRWLLIKMPEVKIKLDKIPKD